MKESKFMTYEYQSAREDNGRQVSLQVTMTNQTPETSRKIIAEAAATEERIKKIIVG